MAIDKRFVFYEGKYLYLKVLSADDVRDSDWIGWFNSEEMSLHNSHHYFPQTMEQQYQFLETCSQRDKLVLGIVDRSNTAQICGIVSLNQINFIHRHAEIAGIQDPKFSRDNPLLFAEAWSLMLRHGFEQLGLQKIYGGTFHPYVPSALTRLFNFEIEGVRKKQMFKNNVYRDVTLVAVFKDTIKYPCFEENVYATAPA